MFWALSTSPQHSALSKARFYRKHSACDLCPSAAWHTTLCETVSVARSSATELISGEFTWVEGDLDRYESFWEFGKKGREKKNILEGTTEAVTLFTCYKIKLYFSKDEKDTLNKEFKTTEKYVCDQVLYFWKMANKSSLKDSMCGTLKYFCGLDSVSLKNERKKIRILKIVIINNIRLILDIIILILD